MSTAFERGGAGGGPASSPEESPDCPRRDPAGFMGPRRALGRTNAFTLPEVLVSVAIVGFLFVSLYAGITAGFGIVSVARENVRATQILIDRMEEMRLYTWTQVSSFGSSTSYIPASFTEPFYPANTNYAVSSLSTNSTASGFTYYGTIAITNSGVSEAYSADLKLVTVTVCWTNGTARTRTMTTFVSQYGMQNYIFN